MTSAPPPILDAFVVEDFDYAILVLNGEVHEGCAPVLRSALLASEKHDHGHIIVDVRHVERVNREAVKALLWELGRAFDDGRTMRLVVRDEHQQRYLNGLGLAGMLPVHATLADAMTAVDTVETAQLATEHVIDIDMHVGDDARARNGGADPNVRSSEPE